MTNVIPFNFQVPAHARNAKSAAMQAMAGGMAGGGFGNRISLKNSKFRLIQQGKEVEVLQVSSLDVVIFALAPHVQRIYYDGVYETGSKDKPACYSLDGITPAADSTKLQSTKCTICPQNVKGSGRQGNTKACAYKKRVIVLPPDDLEGMPYALDISGMSMFGDDIPSDNKFSFKGFFEKLSAHSVAIDAIVTRLSFDDAASVPKLHFGPVRVLTEEEYGVVLQRVNDPEVQKMLKDLVNEVEVEQFEQQKPVAPAVQQVVAPVVPPVVVVPPKKGFGGGAVKEVPAPVVVKSENVVSVDLDLEALKRFDD